MSKKLAVGLDAIVLDVKVGTGAFMKRQVEARRLAQMMVGIGRRMDKKVQALLTDMNQPLGYAVGNALEGMEVSQTLQNAWPTGLTRSSPERAARQHFSPKGHTAPGDAPGRRRGCERLDSRSVSEGCAIPNRTATRQPLSLVSQALAVVRCRYSHRSEKGSSSRWLQLSPAPRRDFVVLLA